MSFQIPANGSTTCGMKDKTAQSVYETIRQSVEDSVPLSSVHIYGSCLYMNDPDNKLTELDLYIDFGKFASILGIHWEMAIS